MLTCYRMKINGQWTQTHCGHTGIMKSLTTHAALSCMRSDTICPQYIFDKNYIVRIPSKEDWSNRNIDIIYYTDRSRHRGLGKSGASVYNWTTDQKHVYSTVFQADLLSGLVLTLYKQSLMRLLQYAQTVKLLWRCSAKIVSKLVTETMMELKQLSLFNSIRLVRVPRHLCHR